MIAVTENAVRGFMVEPCVAKGKYRGIDRRPFEPLIIDNDPDSIAPPMGVQHIWEYWRPGWRRDAYKVYEENSVTYGSSYLELISNLDAAIAVLTLIQSHLEPHEIIECLVYGVKGATEAEIRNGDKFLGYDLACPGGDLCSAVKVLGEEDVVDLRKYRQYLNSNGLFNSKEPLSDYCSDFKKVVQSEANADFAIYAIWSTGISTESLVPN